MYGHVIASHCMWSSLSTYSLFLVHPILLTLPPSHLPPSHLPLTSLPLFLLPLSLPLLSPSITGLPTTKLALYLEERINNFLRTKDSGAGNVTIRVVSSSDKTLDTRTLMKDRFQGDFPDSFPYRTKAMFVFEEIDGVDVCFFGMHVQEYGSDCQAPNTR